MKKTKRKNWRQCYLTKKSLFQFFEKCDSELAENCRQKGCLLCSGKLHRSDYQRKPRGGPKEIQVQDMYRDSFCCAVEGCRKRHTPPSLRFFGRRVYWGVTVVLISAMRHGLKPKRVEALRQHLNIDRRTLERWRQWWLETFVQSPFWTATRARFTTPLCEHSLPLSLCQAFGIDEQDQLVKLLQFLSPLTTCSIPLEQGP